MHSHRHDMTHTCLPELSPRHQWPQWHLWDMHPGIWASCTAHIRQASWLPDVDKVKWLLCWLFWDYWHRHGIWNRPVRIPCSRNIFQVLLSVSCAIYFTYIECWLYSIITNLNTNILNQYYQKSIHVNKKITVERSGYVYYVNKLQDDSMRSKITSQ